MRRPEFGLTTEGHHGGPGVARVKTYGDVFEEYEWHPEPKCADANGEPVNKQTIGLLTMAELAPKLEATIDRPVLDKTGLTGVYQFRPIEFLVVDKMNRTSTPN